MRIGSNPQKQEKKVEVLFHHRIVVVVFIPNEEGFYKDSFDVFKLCIDSLIATIDTKAALTVVNNGSHQKVSDFLGQYLKEKKIDTLISHNINIGKIDALIGAARGAREKLITLTDADILFTKGWQENVENVFSKFSNVGSVSPIPVRRSFYYATSSVLKQILLGKLKFRFAPIPENFSNYNRYLASINWGSETDETKMWPVVEKNGLKAIIGSGHQVLTIHRDILFKTIPTNPSLTLVGNNSEFNYVDQPIDKAGKLRLSTYHNFAYHMGNKVEEWMTNTQEKNISLDNQLEFPETIFSNVNIDFFNSKRDTQFYNFKKSIIKKAFVFFVVKDKKYK